MRFDERFKQHRFKSTSHAAVVGGALTGGWFLHEHLVHGHFRWDLMSILLAMALSFMRVVLRSNATSPGEMCQPGTTWQPV